MKQSELIADLNATIQDQLDRVEEFRSLNESELSTSPSADSWNALQCLEHLNRYAEFYLEQIESKSGMKMKTSAYARAREDEKKEDKEFNLGFWGKKFIDGMLPDENGKINKMKTFKSKNPSKQEASADSLERFQKYQKRWLKILDQAKNLDLNRNKCKLTIPLLKMNLGATMKFVIVHQERHIKQAERAIEIAAA